MAREDWGERLSSLSAPRATGRPTLAQAGDQGDDRRWAALAVLLVGAFLPPLDFFIVNVALPSIRAGLKAGPGAVQLVVSGYATAYAVLLITGGRLGDIYGRRRVFVVGMVGFALSSALSGFAWSPSVLIAGRVLQGLAAAIMAPQSLASIQAIFPDEEKPRALAFYAATFGIASAAGLLLGGALIAASPFGLGWRAIFLINLPVVALTIPAAWVLLKETRADKPQRPDIVGSALIAAALFALVLPLIEGRDRGWPLWSLLLLGCSVPLMLLFAWYERCLDARGRDPLVVPAVLATPGMKRGLVTALLFYALAVFWLMFSVYEQAGRGRTPLQAGLDILPAAGGFILGPLAGGWLAGRLGRWTAATGMVVQALGLLGTGGAILAGRPALLPVPLFALGLGQGIALPALTRAIVSRVEAKWSGLAAGLVTSMFQIGGALAVAIIGGLFYALGGASGGPSLARAYAAGVAAIAFCLFLAAILSGRPDEPKPDEKGGAA